MKSMDMLNFSNFVGHLNEKYPKIDSTSLQTISNEPLKRDCFIFFELMFIHYTHLCLYRFNTNRDQNENDFCLEIAWVLCIQLTELQTVSRYNVWYRASLRAQWKTKTICLRFTHNISPEKKSIRINWISARRYGSYTDSFLNSFRNMTCQFC